MKRVNESGGREGCRKRLPEASPSSRLWEIDDTLSKICQDLSNCRRHTHLYMKQNMSDCQDSLQSDVRGRRATPKRWQEEKFANIVVTLGLHQSIFRCGGLVVRLWQFEGLALTYSGSTFEVEVESGSKLECLKPAQWRPGDRARSGGCQSGLKIMFKVTIRWWRARLTGGGKILFQTNQFSREIPIWSEIFIQWPFKVFYFHSVNPTDGPSL